MNGGVRANEEAANCPVGWLNGGQCVVCTAATGTQVQASRREKRRGLDARWQLNRCRTGGLRLGSPLPPPPAPPHLCPLSPGTYKAGPHSLRIPQQDEPSTTGPALRARDPPRQLANTLISPQQRTLDHRLVPPPTPQSVPPAPTLTSSTSADALSARCRRPGRPHRPGHGRPHLDPPPQALERRPEQLIRCAMCSHLHQGYAHLANRPDRSRPLYHLAPPHPPPLHLWRLRLRQQVTSTVSSKLTSADPALAAPASARPESRVAGVKRRTSAADLQQGQFPCAVCRKRTPPH